jgi:hypothetical protein
MVTKIAKIPLTHQPGEVWEYSAAVDVIGRVIEVALRFGRGGLYDRSHPSIPRRTVSQAHKYASVQPGSNNRSGQLTMLKEVAPVTRVALRLPKMTVS